MLRGGFSLSSGGPFELPFPNRPASLRCPMASPAEEGAAQGDFGRWLQAVFESFDAAGRVKSCRPDPVEPRNVICGFKVWVGPKWTDAEQRHPLQPRSSDVVIPSRFAGGRFRARASIRRPEDCPKAKAPWAPCDPAHCPLIDRFNSHPHSTAFQREDPCSKSVGEPAFPAGSRPTELLEPSVVGTAWEDHLLPLKRPDSALAFRFLRALADSVGPLSPTQLGGRAHTNFTQVERYSAWLESLGLVKVRKDEGRHRAWISLTDKGKGALRDGQAWFSDVKPTIRECMDRD
jgi:predicted transcriptional regulator